MTRIRRIARLVSSGITAFVLLAATGMQANAEGWTEGAPMLNGRVMAASALLGDELYVLGGDAIAGPRSDTTIFDLKGNFWRSTSAMPAGVQQAAAAALDGRVYVSGGYKSNKAHPEKSGGPSRSLWIFNPRIGTWVDGASMPAPRVGHGLVAVDDKLYAIGGKGPDAARVTAYDPAENKWSNTGAAIPAPRVEAAYVAVGNRIYVIGGLSASGNAMSRVDIFDVAKGSWSRGPDLPSPRAGHVAVVLGNAIHVLGGEQRDPPKTHGDHYVMDLDGQAGWRKSVALPTPRHGAVAAADDGKLVVAGGSPGAGFYSVFTESDVVEIFSTTE